MSLSTNVLAIKKGSAEEYLLTDILATNVFW